MRLTCLHGFLGLPRDFDGLAAHLARRAPAVEVVAPNLWDDAGLELSAWSDASRRRAASGDVLLGYSLGGRLALMSFLHPASPHAALVVVAAHPGGLDAEARAARRARDCAWAERLRREPWGPLMAAWDGQEVFSGRANPLARREGDFDRERLAAVVAGWSVANQGDLRPALAAEERPILWVVGAADARYREIAREIARDAPRIEVVEIAGAAHRVPWEQPERFADAVVEFLARVVETGAA